MKLLSEAGFKNRRFLALCIIAAAAIFTILALYIFQDSDDGFYSGSLKIKSPAKAFEEDKSLRAALENKIRNLEKQNQELSKELDQQLENKEKLNDQFADINQKLESLEKDVKEGKKQELIKPQLKSGSQNIMQNSNRQNPLNNTEYGYGGVNNINHHQDFIKQANGTRQNNVDNENANQTASKGIDTKIFSISANKKEYDPKYYLPLGSYATAKLLSSVDVGVGVSSLSEPRPCLIRVESEALSAAFKEDISQKYKTNIKGAMITCEARGDLSSERGYIRLLDMTIEGTKGKIVELAVKGFVSSYGKAGIRGRVIERETDKVWWATLTGFFSSLGNGVSQRYQPSTTITGSVAQTQQNSENILKSGIGAGAAKALDRVSQYYIEKMEQIQPVVSLPQGLVIEVIFTQGTFIDGRIEETINNQNTNSGSNQSINNIGF